MLKQLSRVQYGGDAFGAYIDGKLSPSTIPNFNYDAAIESCDKVLKEKFNVVAYTHFGICPNGPECIRRYKELLNYWVKLIEDLYSKGFTIEQIHNYLIDNVEDYRFSFNYFNNIPYFRKNTIFSIIGVIQYFEWKKKFKS